MAVWSKCVDCGVHIPFKTTRCEECKVKERDRKIKRDVAYKKKRREQFGYSKQQEIYKTTRWKKLRVRELEKADYLCEICELIGTYTPAVDVHHIIPLYKDISKAYDESNLCCLCEDCHSYLHKNDIEDKEIFMEFIQKVMDSQEDKNK